MADRGISEAEVLHILAEYHTVLPRERNKPGHVYRGDVKGRILSVAVDDVTSPSFITIITAYWHDDE